MELKGFNKCPRWLKKKYIEAVNSICQVCHKKSDNLQIHRLKRGNNGGLYTLSPLNSKLSNVKVVCKDCHKKLHSMELGVTK